jgi:cytidyltransferase-like protein
MKKKKQIVVVASGYFDPIHSGHIKYLKEAKKLGDKLIIILNNDVQAKLKKGHSFMKSKERKIILEAIKYVDKVFVSIDKDKTVVKSLKKIKPDIFANGGDKRIENIPEREVCEELEIKMVDKLTGAFLKQSSSKILKKYVKKKGCKKCGGKNK